MRISAKGLFAALALVVATAVSAPANAAPSIWYGYGPGYFYAPRAYAPCIRPYYRPFACAYRGYYRPGFRAFGNRPYFYGPYRPWRGYAYRPYRYRRF